ncbi:DUF3145 domain-containing protein [Cryobacterium sp. 1639]|uniref:DUF3145 domain-containing protein n=1 Tax=Cryobacterium inferilacus TaxID=2866629 RepID=UPI001C72E369|nr:DUF3145 domain-containing protein [Cryobacterium sp. 1639]MBX0298917.1 DUF3145 domain-containing protein [Cryobacterium sp. 1639]
MTAPPTRLPPTARGVLYVHSSPRALCPHVEWAASRTLGEPVNFDWSEQPVLAGAQRAEFFWEGAEGTGAALSSALLGWDHLRFEVTEDPGPGRDGGRWLHTPALGIHFAQTDTAGNIVLPEDRIRAAMASAGGDTVHLHRELHRALGADWDDELDVFRHAGDFTSVVWLHRVG